MKILIVATLKRKVAPDVFASRSRMIYQLAAGLAENGHEVKLLGTGDSYIPGVETIPVVEKSWVEMPPAENEFQRAVTHLTLLARRIREVQSEFDIIHSHLYPDIFPAVIENQLTPPLVVTLHAVYDDYIDEAVATFTKTQFVALSEAYCKLFKKKTPQHIVYNGIDTELYAYQEKKQDYLLWLGRLPKAKNEKGEFLDPKGVRWAIKLAKETKTPLKLGGSVEDNEFYERDVKPHLGDGIEWVSDISSEQSLTKEEVVSLMQNARAFLMTINQEEPFGLVMAEAMSCGTPVIAFNHGSAQEVVRHGKTGFVVNPADGVDGLKAALSQIKTIKPTDCRARAENHFSTEAMIQNYEKLYQKVLDMNRS